MRAACEKRLVRRQFLVTLQALFILHHLTHTGPALASCRQLSQHHTWLRHTRILLLFSKNSLSLRKAQHRNHQLCPCIQMLGKLPDPSTFRTPPKPFLSKITCTGRLTGTLRQWHDYLQTKERFSSNSQGLTLTSLYSNKRRRQETKRLPVNANTARSN